MLIKGIIIAFGLAAGMAWGQTEWEVGALGGFSYARGVSVKGPAGSATAGFANGGVLGVFGGNDMYEHWSGEVRYLYRFSNLRLSSGGTTVSFGGHTHIIHADFLGHFAPRRARVRPFIAFGAGVKGVQGTGIESAGQPLGRLAALTHTSELLGFADVGAGVKVSLTRSVRFRVEVRDYISPKPTKVIAAAPGATLSGVLNDIVGTAGISFTF
ncbi:MAG: hypothetical protein JJE04_07640 [Acidobacteriia bacterium]|nr:hypothetical protein [Terriglobia bacterium]